MPSQHENYAESVPKLYGIKKVFCFCKKNKKRIYFSLNLANLQVKFGFFLQNFTKISYPIKSEQGSLGTNQRGSREK